MPQTFGSKQDPEQSDLAGRVGAVIPVNKGQEQPAARHQLCASAPPGSSWENCTQEGPPVSAPMHPARVPRIAEPGWGPPWDRQCVLCGQTPGWPCQLWAGTPTGARGPSEGTHGRKHVRQPATKPPGSLTENVRNIPRNRDSGRLSEST